MLGMGYPKDSVRVVPGAHRILRVFMDDPDLQEQFKVWDYIA